MPIESFIGGHFVVDLRRKIPLTTTETVMKVAASNLPFRLVLIAIAKPF